MKKAIHTFSTSEELAGHFAPYREEAPLVSNPEVKELLDRRSVLSTTKWTTRHKTIMTLSGIFALSLAIYFFLLNPQLTHKSLDRVNQKVTPRSFDSRKEPSTTKEQAVSASAKTLTTYSEPHAGLSALEMNDAELARLGIVAEGDSVVYYQNRPHDNGHNMGRSELCRFTVSSRTNGFNSIDKAPNLVDPPTFFPVFITKGNGEVRVFRFQDSASYGMTAISDGALVQQFRNWLKLPGRPGLRALGFSTSSISDGANTSNTVNIRIGKDLPESMFPLVAPDIEGYDKRVIEDLTKLAHYYDGSGPNVERAWPSNLTVKVDTETAADILNEIDHEVTQGNMARMRGVLERLHELVPVRVTTNTGDWLLWYEPSKIFKDRLPLRYQASVGAMAAKPQSDYIYAQSGDSITISFTKRPDRLILQDLVGGIIESRSVSDLSTSVSFGLKQTASQLYLVVAEYGDGTKDVFRVLARNLENIKFNDGKTFEHPLTSFIQLSNAALNKLGLQNDKDVVIQYHAMGGPKDGAFVSGILRSWGMMTIGNGMMDRSSIPKGIETPHFFPTFVTDGLGRKRSFTYQVQPNHVYDSAYAAEEFQQIDKLIPILVRESDSGRTVTIGARDLVYWYKPTNDFLAALPVNIRESIESSHLPVNGKNAARSNIMNTTGISASLYPNPSSGEVHLRFTALSSQIVSVTLRNLLGQGLKPPTDYRISDSTIVDLDLKGIDDGIYLVDIANNAGDHVIERVVIVR